MEQVPYVKEPLVPDEVVAHAGEGDHVDPVGVVLVLLEACRAQGGGDVGVQHRHGPEEGRV